MNWNEFVKEKLNQPSWTDGLNLQYKNEENTFVLPHIIKFSLILAGNDNLINNKRLNIVFPEKKELYFLFALSKVIDDIYNGIVEVTYDPHTFVKGQKLKYGNCIVEFDSIQINNDVEMLCIRLAADLKYSVPISHAPFFQTVETKKRLSKYDAFSRVYCSQQDIKYSQNYYEDIIINLKNHKTHMNGAVFCISKLSYLHEMIENIKINGEKLDNILLTGKLDYEGNIKNIGKGQLIGIPSIVIGSDLYSANTALYEGVPATAFIIDVSNEKQFENQLDILDELSQKDFPIICISDTANSFNLKYLEDRGFDTWRWDKYYIPQEFCEKGKHKSNELVKNCIEKKFDFIKCSCEEVSNSFNILNIYKRQEDFSGPMIETFNKLFNMIFFAMRNVIELTREQQNQFKDNIEECDCLIDEEKKYISKEMYDDIKKILKYLDSVFSYTFSITKIEAIIKIFKQNKNKNICIVVPDRIDRKLVENYWKTCVLIKKEYTSLVVMHATEYLHTIKPDIEIVIISCWLKEEIMRKLLNCNISKRYLVLLYECEQTWQKIALKNWSNILNRKNNVDILKRSFEDFVRVTDIQESSENKTNTVIYNDELTEIETILSENKYKRYLSSTGNRSPEIFTQAVPVEFTGDYFAFYKNSHSIICVTDILLYGKAQPKTKRPNELIIGDIVVVRESQRDILKDLADVILKNSGMEKCREISGIWRKMLIKKISLLGEADIFNRLKLEGCTKGLQSMKQWIYKDDIISPQDKEDLVCIARALNDSVLMERIDEIFEAGKTVKKAHVKAGKVLSEKLKYKIAENLDNYCDFDAHYFWEPIVILIEGIGNINVLKIIDIGDELTVDTVNVNKLLRE